MANQIFINIGNVWKSVTDTYINVGGVWKTVNDININVGVAWKSVDIVSPSIPSIYSLAENTPDVVTITIFPSTDNVAVVGYEIWRSLSNSNYSYYDATTTTSYDDNNVIYGNTYYYKVLAYDAANNKSALSNYDFITIGA